MFPMTMTINNEHELAKVLGVLGALPATAAPAKEKPAKKPEAQPEPSQAAPAPSASAPASTGQAPAAQPSTSDEVPDEVTFDALKAVFLKFANGNRDGATAMLAKFGAAKLSELKPEQYAAAMAAMGA